MHSLAECVEITDFLEEVPALSTCTRDVLVDFVAHNAVLAHCDAGKVLCGLQQDHNLYVLTSGTAALHVGPDVTIRLEPGDYVGQGQHTLAGTVVALSDVEVAVIGPQDVAHLQQASSRDRHPSRIGWQLERTTPVQRRRRAHRRTVLISKAS